MSNKIPRVAKNCRESTTPGTELLTKRVLSFSSDGLAQRRLNLS